MTAAERLGDTVRAARASRSVVAAPGLDVAVDEAYAIQAKLFAERELVGYKLGLTSAAKQAQMGHPTPVYGRVAPEMVHEGRLAAGAFIQPRCEPEVAVVLAGGLPAGATAGAAAAAAPAAFLAIDVLDSVWADYRFSLAEVVADGTSGGGFVLGERPVPLEGHGELRLLRDGAEVARGPIAAIGDWAANLAWLAGEVGGLAPGCVVFLGSPAAAVELAPGVLELHGPDGSLLTAIVEGPS